MHAHTDCFTVKHAHGKVGGTGSSPLPPSTAAAGLCRVATRSLVDLSSPCQGQAIQRCQRSRGPLHAHLSPQPKPATVKATATRVLQQATRRNPLPWLWVAERGSKAGRLHVHLLCGSWLAGQVAERWDRGTVDVIQLGSISAIRDAAGYGRRQRGLVGRSARRAQLHRSRCARWLRLRMSLLRMFRSWSEAR